MQINWVYITLGLQGILVFQASSILASLAAAYNGNGRLKSSGLYVGSLFVALITAAIAAVFFEEWSNDSFAFTKDVDGGGLFVSLIKLVVISWPTSVVLLSAGVLLLSLLAICMPRWVLVLYDSLAGKPEQSKTTSCSGKAISVQDESLSDEQSAPIGEHHLAPNKSSNPQSWAELESNILIGFAAFCVLVLVLLETELGKILSWCLGLLITGLLFGFLFSYLPTRVSAKAPRKKIVSLLVMPLLYAASFCAFLYLIFFFPLALAEFIWGKNVGFSYTYAFLAQIFTLGGVSLQNQIVNSFIEPNSDK